MDPGPLPAGSARRSQIQPARFENQREERPLTQLGIRRRISASYDQTRASLEAAPLSVSQG